MSEKVLPEVDELLQGESATWSAYLPKALIAELKRAAVMDGVKSTGAYAARLLVFALRRREAERLEQQLSRRR